MGMILGVLYFAAGIFIIWKILSDEVHGRVPLACARNVFLVGFLIFQITSAMYVVLGQYDTRYPLTNITGTLALYIIYVALFLATFLFGYRLWKPARKLTGWFDIPHTQRGSSGGPLAHARVRGHCARIRDAARRHDPAHRDALSDRAHSSCLHRRRDRRVVAGDALFNRVIAAPANLLHAAKSRSAKSYSAKRHARQEHEDMNRKTEKRSPKAVMAYLGAVMVAACMPMACAYGGAPRESTKPILDATHFVHRVGLERVEQPALPGTSDVRMIYAFETGLHSNKDRISRLSVRSNISSMRGDPEIVVVDIEHLPLETVRRHRGASDSEVQRAHDTVRMILDEVRRRWPSAEIGLFDMLPPQHMHAWDPQHADHDEYMAALKRAEYRIDPVSGERDESSGLLDAVDFLAPAFYLHEQRLQLYRRDKRDARPLDENRGIRKLRDWISETVAAARTTGKPVYPFVWHRIHSSGKMSEAGFDTARYVGDRLYRLMLELSLEYADGVIIWSRREMYDENDPWQQVLQKVLDQ